MFTYDGNIFKYDDQQVRYVTLIFHMKRILH